MLIFFASNEATLLARVHALREAVRWAVGQKRPPVKTGKYDCATLHVLRRPGGYGEVSEPDPISNSVVKRLSADGTMS